MWQNWYWKDILPYPGGWAQQPLDVAVALEAMSLAYATGKEKDWTKHSTLQRELRLWLEADDE